MLLEESSPLALSAGSAEALPTASDVVVGGCASWVGCTLGCASWVDYTLGCASWVGCTLGCASWVGCTLGCVTNGAIRKLDLELGPLMVTVAYGENRALL